MRNLKTPPTTDRFEYEARYKSLIDALNIVDPDVYETDKKSDSKYPRRSGRTTRMLIEALLYASYGHRVIIYGHTPHYSNDLHILACQMSAQWSKVCPSYGEAAFKGIVRYPVEASPARLQKTGCAHFVDHHAIAQYVLKVYDCTIEVT